MLDKIRVKFDKNIDLKGGKPSKKILYLIYDSQNPVQEEFILDI